LPFYPWLRQIAWDRLVHLHEQHVHAQKRSVIREDRFRLSLSDQSVMLLADQLAGSQTSPSGRLVRKERRDRVRDALERLSEQDREVLVLRFLEDLTVREVAAVLQIREGAVHMRQLRALERLCDLLDRQWEELS